jgi:hypothetical protein
LEEEFSDGFTIVKAEEQISHGPMHGKEYERRMLNVIFKKKETMTNTVNLFSYGTLRYENVQMQTFGRKLEGKDDVLPGYILKKLQITDPDVIAKSGEAVHSIIEFSGSLLDRIPGMVFKISPEELAHADRYEVADYKRIQVKLLSGTLAWVYVRKNGHD